MAAPISPLTGFPAVNEPRDTTRATQSAVMNIRERLRRIEATTNLLIGRVDVDAIGVSSLTAGVNGARLTGDLTLVGGSNVAVTSDGKLIQISCGLAAPALPLNSLQFNNAGAFGGSDELTWDPSTLVLYMKGTFTFDNSQFADSFRFQGLSAAQQSYLYVYPAATGPGTGAASGFICSDRDYTATSYCAGTLSIGNDAVAFTNLAYGASSNKPFAWAFDDQYVASMYENGNLRLFPSWPTAFGVPADTGYRLEVDGTFNLTDELNVTDDPGVAGEVLTSAGPGLPPVWGAGGSSDFDTILTDADGDVLCDANGNVLTEA